jgi:hypothetical protein
MDVEAERVNNVGHASMALLRTQRVLVQASTALGSGGRTGCGWFGRGSVCTVGYIAAVARMRNCVASIFDRGFHQNANRVSYMYF